MPMRTSMSVRGMKRWNRGHRGLGRRHVRQFPVSSTALPHVTLGVSSSEMGCCAGMMYADSAYAGDANNLNLGGTLDSLLYKVGLQDAIKRYESDLTLPQIWAKYSKWVPSLIAEAEGLLAHGAAVELRPKGADLLRIMNPLKRAFAAGAIPGERDRARLSELVGATRAFKSDLEDAKAKYGWAPPSPEQVAANPVAVAAGATGGFPMWLLLIPFGLIAAMMFGKKR